MVSALVAVAWLQTAAARALCQLSELCSLCRLSHVEAVLWGLCPRGTSLRYRCWVSQPRSDACAAAHTVWAYSCCARLHLSL